MAKLKSVRVAVPRALYVLGERPTGRLALLEGLARPVGKCLWRVLPGRADDAEALCAAQARDMKAWDRVLGLRARESDIESNLRRQQTYVRNARRTEDADHYRAAAATAERKLATARADLATARREAAETSAALRVLLATLGDPALGLAIVPLDSPEIVFVP